MWLLTFAMYGNPYFHSLRVKINNGGIPIIFSKLQGKLQLVHEIGKFRNHQENESD